MHLKKKKSIKKNVNFSNKYQCIKGLPFTNVPTYQSLKFWYRKRREYNPRTICCPSPKKIFRMWFGHL